MAKRRRKSTYEKARRALEANKARINATRYGVPSSKRLKQVRRWNNSPRTWS
jgi:hypothetical protein